MDELDMGSGFLSILNEVPDVNPDFTSIQEYDEEEGSGSGSAAVGDRGIIISLDGPTFINNGIPPPDHHDHEDVGYVHQVDSMGPWINQSIHTGMNASGVTVTSCSNSNIVTLTCFKYNTHHTSEQVLISFKIATMLTTLFVVLGLLFNTLGIVVFLSQRMKRSSTRVYLLTLAISDNCYLVVAFLSRGLEGIKCLFFPQSSIDIYHQSDFTCKGLQYLFDLFSDYSASIIVVFTIERFLACYYAILYKEKCNRKFATYLSITLFVVIAILISPYHMQYIKHDKKYGNCKVDPGSISLFTYLYMAEATIFRIIPIYLIAVINILIIAKLWKVYSRKKKRTLAICSSRVSTSTSLYSSSDNLQKKNGNKSTRDQNAKTTLMLVLISTFYLLCYQPIIVCYIVNKLTDSGILDVAAENLLIFKNYSRVLYIWGYTVNFFFYTLASEAFRQEIKRLCCMSHVATEDRTSYYLSARSLAHRPSTAAALHELERERHNRNISHV